MCVYIYNIQYYTIFTYYSRALDRNSSQITLINVNVNAILRHIFTNEHNLRILSIDVHIICK